jgi:hypothetical protein
MATSAAASTYDSGNRQGQGSAYAYPKQICGPQCINPDDVESEQASQQRYRTSRRDARVVYKVRERPSTGDEIAAGLTVHAARVHNAHSAGKAARHEGQHDRSSQDE